MGQGQGSGQWRWARVGVLGGDVDQLGFHMVQDQGLHGIGLNWAGYGPGRIRVRFSDGCMEESEEEEGQVQLAGIWVG